MDTPHRECPAVAVRATDRTNPLEDALDGEGDSAVAPRSQLEPPSLLTSLQNWVLWQLESRGPGQKPAKKPFHVDGRTPASVTAPQTWATYDEARHALLNGASHCSGLGIVLTGKLVGVDLDLPADDPQCLAVIERFQGTYCERSPNGNLRIFTLGVPQRSGKRGPAEVYGEGSPRYLTFTGNHIGGTSTEITDQQPALDWFHETYLALADESAGRSVPKPNNRTSDDDDIIDKAGRAANGDKFRALFNGDASAYASASEADLALCAIFAFWSDDPEQIDRLFRRSGLFREEKWNKQYADGSTYGSRTADKALKTRKGHHTGRKGGGGAIPNSQGLLRRVIRAIEQHPVLRGVRFDLMADAPVLANGEPVPDELVLDLRIIAETKHRTVSDALANDGIRRVALMRPFDALLEMFEQLPVWDGVERLDTWLIRYAGAADDQISRRCGRLWLISTVARAYRPGCQAKYVLVLQGRQDLGKSKLVARLAGVDRFFMSMTGHEIGSRDTKLAISKHWIGEFADLGKLPLAERNSIKGFIADTADTFRAPYARADVTAPRRCVFVVTENPDGTGWLNDPTGGVRWWPIPCTTIDFPAFDRDRDQLLAEALRAFRNGEAWWPADEIQGLQDRQEALQREDPWLDDVASIVEGQDEVLLPDIVRALIGRWKKPDTIDLAPWKPADDHRVAACLMRLGFERFPNPVFRTLTDLATGDERKRKVRPWRRVGTPE